MPESMKMASAQRNNDSVRSSGHTFNSDRVVDVSRDAVELSACVVLAPESSKPGSTSTDTQGRVRAELRRQFRDVCATYATSEKLARIPYCKRLFNCRIYTEN